MKKSLVSKAAALVGALAMTFGFAACGQTNTADSSNSNTSDLKKVTFMLSWAPDTNLDLLRFFLLRKVTAWSVWRFGGIRKNMKKDFRPYRVCMP